MSKQADDDFRMPGKPRHGSEIEAELEFHLAMRAEELEAQGTDPDQALPRAEEEFGDLEATRLYCLKQDRIRRRKEKLGSPFKMIRSEASLAARGLIRRPKPVLVPMGILAISVALNALVLSVVRGVLLAPLPFQAAERVVVIEEISEGGGLSRASYPVLDAWRREARQVEALAAYLDSPLPLMSGTGPIHAEGAKVTLGFFGLLSDPLRAGRAFTLEEHGPDGPKVVAISEGLWRRSFGSEPQILGKNMEVDGGQYEVVAVVRDEIAFPDGTELWLPIEPSNPDLMEVAGAKIFVTLARLRPGVSLDGIGLELAEISGRVPGGATNAAAIWVNDRLLGDVRTPLLLLQGAVLLVLLAGAANAGGLLLARGVRRRGEMALRASLGAGSTRVVVGLLLEGLLLGTSAGLAGLILAGLSLGPALALVPVDLPRVDQIVLNPQVAFIAMFLAAGTGIATALVPALTGSRTSPSETLRESSQGGGTPPWIRRSLEGLVVAQVALALILTSGAGLLIRSFISTIQENPGFETEGVTLLDVSLPDYRYPDEAARISFARELLDRAAGLPGSQAVALGRNLPISGSNMTSPLRVEGSTGMTDAVQVVTVTEDYFDVLRMPILEGRGFGGADETESRPVILVGPGIRTPEGPPVTVGHRAHSFFGAQEFREVTGVVGEIRHQNLRVSPSPMAYEPFFQKGGSSGFTLLVRSDAPAGVVAQGARELVWTLDPELAVDQVSTMESRIRRSMAAPRFYTVVLSGFGVLAVLLALAGCQAGLSHRVEARRREIGIRVALGAPRASVRGMILRRGLFLTGSGLLVGLLAAIPSTRLLETQLYRVTAEDPLTYVALLFLLLGAGALASDLPARRAAAMDPAEVLREE